MALYKGFRVVWSWGVVRERGDRQHRHGCARRARRCAAGLGGSGRPTGASGAHVAALCVNVAPNKRRVLPGGKLRRVDWLHNFASVTRDERLSVVGCRVSALRF